VSKISEILKSAFSKIYEVSEKMKVAIGQN
jgi:hypothetical protein